MKWTASMGYRRFPDLPLDTPDVAGREDHDPPEDREDDSTPIHPEQDEARAQAKMFGGVMEKVEADRDSLRAKLEWMTANRDGFEAASKRHEADATTLRAKLAEAERQLGEWHRSRGFAYSSQPSPVVPNNPAYVAASPKSLTPCDDCPERQKDGSCPLSPAYLAESRLTRYAALERAVREMHPGNWSPNVVRALDALTHAPSAPDDERGCPTCATLAGKIERLRAEVERLTRDRDRLAGYALAAMPLCRDALTHIVEDRPEEAARTIFRVMCALASAAKEGADQ